MSSFTFNFNRSLQHSEESLDFTSLKCLEADAWFPSSRFRAVQPFPLQKYVRITFIRNNSG